MQEPLIDLYSNSQLLVLNFSEIPPQTPKDENIQLYFDDLLSHNLDPTSAQNRQRFNNHILRKTQKRYLVSRYAEDRSAMLTGSHIAQQARTYHLGIDIFSQHLETVYAPCDGEIITIGQEPGGHSFGHYMIIKPRNRKVPYIFLGHLSQPSISVGPITSGKPIAKLGNFTNQENGGWSRHLHLQMLSELPKSGVTPMGYSTKKDLETNARLYPDPSLFFPELSQIVKVKEP